MICIKTRHYNFRLFLIFLFLGTVICTQAQQTPDTSRKKYSNNAADTAGRGRYLQKMKSELGLSETQALALRESVRTSRAQIGRIQRDSSLSAQQKQQMIRGLMRQAQQTRNSVLTPAQLQQLKMLMTGKLPEGDQKQKVSQNLEALKHPLRGGTFKSMRTIQ